MEITRRSDNSAPFSKPVRPATIWLPLRQASGALCTLLRFGTSKRAGTGLASVTQCRYRWPYDGAHYILRMLWTCAPQSQLFRSRIHPWLHRDHMTQHRESGVVAAAHRRVEADQVLVLQIASAQCLQSWSYTPSPLHFMIEHRMRTVSLYCQIHVPGRWQAFCFLHDRRWLHKLRHRTLIQC
jgi:hypothetical protein